MFLDTFFSRLWFCRWISKNILKIKIWSSKTMKDYRFSFKRFFIVISSIWGTANISEILYAKLYFHLKKPKTCTLRIWLLKFNLYKVLKTYVLGIIFTCLKSIYFLTFLSAKTHYQKQSNIFIPNKCLWCYY